MQVWRKPGTVMGRYRQQYDYRCPHAACRGGVVEPAVLPAAAVINWSDLGTRIGDRKRPLSAKTVARIEAGYRKYAAPFLAAAAGQTWERRPGVRTWPVDGPVPTQATTAQHGLACPPMLVPAGGTWNDDAQPVTDPMRTRTTRETEGLACPPYLVPLRSGRNRSMPVTDPLATVVADGSGHGLAVPDTAFIMRNNEGGAEMSTPPGEPLRTLTAKGHQSLVDWRLLIPYYGTGVASSPDYPLGTLSTRDRYALASGQLPGFNVEDILFRMLQVPEIHLAMAFPDSYVILGRTQAAQIRQLGNAVTPPVSTLIWSAIVECIRNEPLEPAAGVQVPATSNLVAAPETPARESARLQAPAETPASAPGGPHREDEQRGTTEALAECRHCGQFIEEEQDSDGHQVWYGTSTLGPDPIETRLICRASTATGHQPVTDDEADDKLWQNQLRLLRTMRDWPEEEEARCRHCGQPIEEHWDNDGSSGDHWVLSRDPDGLGSGDCPESGGDGHQPTPAALDTDR
jgi:hypothetical protein